MIKIGENIGKLLCHLKLNMASILSLYGFYFSLFLFSEEKIQ